MNKLKKYAGLLNEEAPKNHFLAYITADERDMLVEAGGKETATPSGILAYPPKYSSVAESKAYHTPSNQGGGGGNNDSGDAREQYATKQTSTGFVGGGGAVTYTGGDKDDPSSYAVSDAIVDPEVVQQQKEQYAEQFGGVAPLGSRPVDYSTKYEYKQIKHIADSKLDSIKAKLTQAGHTGFNKDATLSEMKEYVKTLNRTGKIEDSWKTAVDKHGNPLYDYEDPITGETTIEKWEREGYIPQSPTMPTPGFFGPFVRKASPTGTLGAPLTYDQLMNDFDTITKVGQSQGMDWQERLKVYSPKQYESLTGTIYDPHTKTYKSRDKMGGGGSEDDRLSRVAAPYEVGGTPAPQQSQVANYFANLNNTNLGINQNYLNTYNTAKANLAKSLNMTPNTQQYGYNNPFQNNYGRSMDMYNPFFDELTEQGLI